MESFLAFSHFASFTLLAALLAAEFVLIQPELDQHSIMRLKKLDIGYGLSAGLVLSTGIARMFYEKGTVYYLDSPAFWIKVGLFGTVGLVSIYPTVRFIRLKRGTAAHLDHYTTIKILIPVQCTLIPAILACAVLMAKGFY